jgi:hypothetical protein
LRNPQKSSSTIGNPVKPAERKHQMTAHCRPMSILMFTIFFSCVLPHFLTSDMLAQTVGSEYRIETVQGSVFTGELVSESDEAIVLRTRELGEITIRRSDIRSIREIDPTRYRDGQYWFDNPQPTRYLFATNAIGLKSGQGYYQNTWIFFNNVNYGVTDNVSLGVGIVPIFLFGAGALPIWIMPKVSIPVQSESFHLAAGGLFGGILGEDAGGLGIVYGVGTVGNADRNLSVGLGYGYAGSEWSNTPFFNISAMTRTSRTTYVITENYFFAAGDANIALLSIALRYANERLAVDFGLVRPTDVGGDFIAFPWLGITVPFGKK